MVILLDTTIAYIVAMYEVGKKGGKQAGVSVRAAQDIYKFMYRLQADKTVRNRAKIGGEQTHEPRS